MIIQYTVVTYYFTPKTDQKVSKRRLWTFHFFNQWLQVRRLSLYFLLSIDRLCQVKDPKKSSINWWIMQADWMKKDNQPANWNFWTIELMTTRTHDIFTYTFYSESSEPPMFLFCNSHLNHQLNNLHPETNPTQVATRQEDQDRRSKFFLFASMVVIHLHNNLRSKVVKQAPLHHRISLFPGWDFACGGTKKRQILGVT